MTWADSTLALDGCAGYAQARAIVAVEVTPNTRRYQQPRWGPAVPLGLGGFAAGPGGLLPARGGPSSSGFVGVGGRRVRRRYVPQQHHHQTCRDGGEPDADQ
ncbi:hypothetical protein [Nocardia neocaledoniensis]|uniref:hypothetical protein n=1 Tax=Nocardia neocaledoniensis TaxID=236511 RepID=UPI003CC80D76